jgi:hypothetical protein
MRPDGKPGVQLFFRGLLRRSLRTSRKGDEESFGNTAAPVAVAFKKSRREKLSGTHTLLPANILHLGHRTIWSCLANTAGGGIPASDNAAFIATCRLVRFRTTECAGYGCLTSVIVSNLFAGANRLGNLRGCLSRGVAGPCALVREGRPQSHR